MIETHVVNAVLRVDLKEEPFFKILTFLNGLVAPTFLFCAGFALAITLQRKWREFITFRPSMWRYVIRLLFILVVAYSLHLPFFSLARLRALTDEHAWLSFYQVDILQTIAVTLLLSVALAVVLRSESIFVKLYSLIGLTIIFISPIIREMDLTALPVWLRPYLTMQFKSQFPLFPWSAFLMGGMIVGYWFLKFKKDGKEYGFIKWLCYGSLVGIALSLSAEVLPVAFYPHHEFWRASPEFFFVRFGLVLLAGTGLWYYEHRKTISPNSVFSMFGQESLLVYVVHLLIVYGYDYEWSFIRYFGPHLNYAEGFALFLALSLTMYGMAFVWHWMKGWNMTVAKAVQFATLAGIVVTFIIKES